MYVAQYFLTDLIIYLIIFPTVSFRLITNDEQTSVLTPIGTEIWDYKALNVQEDMEWVCDPKQAASSENATAEQINQNPFIKPPKIQGKNTKR